MKLGSHTFDRVARACVIGRLWGCDRQVDLQDDESGFWQSAIVGIHPNQVNQCVPLVLSPISADTMSDQRYPSDSTFFMKEVPALGFREVVWFSRQIRTIHLWNRRPPAQSPSWDPQEDLLYIFTSPEFKGWDFTNKKIHKCNISTLLALALSQCTSREHWSDTTCQLG